jgi:hypothetical protein
MSAKEEIKGMDILKEIANISGKSGLYKVLKPSRAGVIVESLNEKKEKLMIGPSARISVLKDVSVFTEGEQDSIPLGDLFLRIHEKFGASIDLDVKTASDKDLVEFLNEVLPDFDRSKVYVSDIKKIVSWYAILKAHTPDAFESKEDELAEDEVVVATEIEQDVKPAKAEKKSKKK